MPKKRTIENRTTRRKRKANVRAFLMAFVCGVTGFLFTGCSDLMAIGDSTTSTGSSSSSDGNYSGFVYSDDMYDVVRWEKMTKYWGYTGFGSTMFDGFEVGGYSLNSSGKLVAKTGAEWTDKLDGDKPNAYKEIAILYKETAMIGYEGKTSGGNRAILVGVNQDGSTETLQFVKKATKSGDYDKVALQETTRNDSGTLWFDDFLGVPIQGALVWGDVGANMTQAGKAEPRRIYASKDYIYFSVSKISGDLANIDRGKVCNGASNYEAQKSTYQYDLENWTANYDTTTVGQSAMDQVFVIPRRGENAGKIFSLTGKKDNGEQIKNIYNITNNLITCRNWAGDWETGVNEAYTYYTFAIVDGKIEIIQVTNTTGLQVFSNEAGQVFAISPYYATTGAGSGNGSFITYIVKSASESDAKYFMFNNTLYKVTPTAIEKWGGLGTQWTTASEFPFNSAYYQAFVNYNWFGNNSGFLGYLNKGENSVEIGEIKIENGSVVINTIIYDNFTDIEKFVGYARYDEVDSYLGVVFYKTAITDGNIERLQEIKYKDGAWQTKNVASRYLTDDLQANLSVDARTKKWGYDSKTQTYLYTVNYTLISRKII